MVRTILSDNLIRLIEKLNLNNVYEIRLRRNCPVIINYLGENIRLKNDSGENVYVTNVMLEQVLKKATEYSLYAFNSQIKQGFITARGGIRIGIAGESVNSDNFVPTTIKNINSINIRIPHEVIGCSKQAFKFIYNKESGVKNTLIIAPPGAGKTTFLRDICRNFSQIQDKIYNTLLVDERFEISSTVNGDCMLDVGMYTDVVSGANKMFAFTNGIRSLKPDIIITDELMGGEDVEACKRAIKSGVKVIASVHANNHREIMDRVEFKELITARYFERIITLSNRCGPGMVETILDENLNCIYF